MGEEPWHELELLSDADGLFDFETIFFGKTAEAFFRPERLVVDVKDAVAALALVHAHVAEIAEHENLENRFEAQKVRERNEDVSFGIQVLFAEVDHVNGVVYMFQNVANDNQVELAVFGVLLVEYVVVFVEPARNLVGRLHVFSVFGLDGDFIGVFGVKHAVSAGAGSDF